MKSRAATKFTAWVEAHGGVRAAGRELERAAETVRRWAAAERVPGKPDRAMLEERTGTPAGEWDVLEAATKKRTAKAAPVAPAPPPKRPPPPPPPSAPELEAVDPATVSEMQARLRQIPGELARLRKSVVEGDTAVTSAETLRRLLADEAKALGLGITSQGTATVEEVEQLRGLVRDVTSGCEGCRTRVTAALREMGR